MIENGVPRSYLIKQCRNDLNKLCHVTSTPGTFEGAQIPFKSILCQQISAFKQKILTLILIMRHSKLKLVEMVPK